MHLEPDKSVLSELFGKKRKKRKKKKKKKKRASERRQCQHTADIKSALSRNITVQCATIPCPKHWWRIIEQKRFVQKLKAGKRACVADTNDTLNASQTARVHTIVSGKMRSTHLSGIANTYWQQTTAKLFEYSHPSVWYPAVHELILRQLQYTRYCCKRFPRIIFLF